MKKQVRITYSGTVHGVGFRFTAERIAASLNLTGWVRNAPDGTVELVAEGEEENLIGLIDNIKKTMGHYIHGTKVSWREYKNEFNSFGIKF